MGLLFLLALGAILFVLSASAGTAWFLTHPPRRTLAWAVSRALPADPSQLTQSRAFRSWTMPREGVVLHAWEMPGDRADGPTVILTHGWGDSRLGALARVPLACSLASSVIAWDLRGHGESSGVCTLGTHEVDDLLALIDQIEPQQRARGIVLWGWSLGAGVGIVAAERLRAASASDAPSIRATIIESAYRHVHTPAANVLEARALPHRINLPIALGAIGAWLGSRVGAGTRWRGFDRAHHAAALKSAIPTLVLHGSADIVCPIADAQEIAHAAGAQLAIVDGAGHNDLWTDATFARPAGEAVTQFLTP